MLIGLTGPTGAGKSEVCAILLEYGFDIIDADLIAREVTAAGSECLLEIVSVFTDEILLPSGELNRKVLGLTVFSDEKQLKKLENIIFPHILAEIDNRVKVLRLGSKGIFLDAPTLFESGADKSCDKICCVLAPTELRKCRIIKRDNITPEAAELRMSSQPGDEFYTERSHYVIMNNGSEAELQNAVRKMLRSMNLE